MKTIDVEQGSMQWIMARLGIPTASCFNKILTEKTLKPSGQRKEYLFKCLAEWRIGEPIEKLSTLIMDRGTGMEEEARNWYAFKRDVDPMQVGLCTTDDGKIGASPDALVGDDGMLEIKCPMAHTHLKYLMGGIQEYRMQIQGGLYVTGRKWCDFLSYNPKLPNLLKRIERDEEVQEKLHAALTEFVSVLEDKKIELMKLDELNMDLIGREVVDVTPEA